MIENEIYSAFARFLKLLMDNYSCVYGGAKISFDPRLASFMSDVINSSIAKFDADTKKVDLFEGIEIYGVKLGVSMSRDEFKNTLNYSRKSMLGFRVWDTRLKIMVSTRGNYDFCMGPSGDISQFEPWCDIHHDLKESHIPMQSTGVKDLRGDEIFEGDVLYVSSNIPEINNYYYLVKSVKDFLLHRGSFRNSLFGFLIHGNIYENPELLERLK